MGKPTGFLEIKRAGMPTRPVEERLKDWKEVYLPMPVEQVKQQASRCMDCGVPFCHTGTPMVAGQGGIGCPLNNIIPDWNDLVYRDRWKEAIDRLHATNNFPEFTGRLCPAPCEASCVLGINEPPVTIKYIEVNIIDRAWKEGWVVPLPPKVKTGKKVAIIGSGPAGLACAQQLARVGHAVTVFERDDRIGGLLRYGIPEFKMEKRHLDRRLKQMEAEGVVFRTKSHIGVNVDANQLRKDFDAVVLSGGATWSRDLKVPGRELKGIHLAMEYLPQSNRVQEGDTVKDQILATGKDVIILGGGDTGADCLGTVHRQKAKSVKQYEILPRPPENRANDNPWPDWSKIFRTSSAHEEGGERDFNITTKEFIGENGSVKALKCARVEWENQPGGPPKMKEVAGSEFEVPAQLVLLALGFMGPEQNTVLKQLGVELDNRGNVKADEDKMTNVEGVFTAGDMTRGQSLIVWAIAEGRTAAKGVDRFLMGSTELP